MRSIYVVSMFGASVLIGSFTSCNKNKDISPQQQTNSIPLDSIYNPVDPAVASSIGFFLDDWQPKTFVVPDNVAGTASQNNPTDTIRIDLNKVVTKVPKYIFGNNVNQWMGQVADQSVLMGYIKDLNPNVLRFPGGSISDLYFWSSPVNAPPSDAATTLYNTDLTSKNVVSSDYWYGTNLANWTISLDNYYKLLEQTGSAGVITVNYAYARYGKGPNPVQTAAHLAAEWVRHDKGRTRFWEVGNENNGNWEAGYKINLSDNKDGQPEIITGALYGQHFKVFADSMRKAAEDIGVSIKIGAQVIGTDPINSYNPTDKSWNFGLFQSVGDYADFFIVHDYYTPYHENSTASVILTTAISETKAISDYLTKNTAQNGVQMKPIAVTEWNIESEGSKQKVSAVAGMHAVLTIGEMLSNNFGEASRWDLSNAWAAGNDHGLFNNTAGETEPGASPWNPRPVFYYLYYFQKFFGDRLVNTVVSPSTSDLNAYSSTFSSGQAGTIIVNKGIATHTAVIAINHFDPGTKYYWYVLKPGSDNGEFSGQVLINDISPSGNSGGDLNYALIKAFSAALSSGSFTVSVPPRGILFLVADKN